MKSPAAEHEIAVTGFEKVKDAAHMIAWLGRGDDIDQWVVRDAEAEILRQTPDARVESVHLNSSPAIEAKAIPLESDETKQQIDGVRVRFSLDMRIARGDGTNWRLIGVVAYERDHITSQQAQQLKLDFNVVSGEQL